MTFVPYLLYQPGYSINTLSQKIKNHQIMIPFVDIALYFAGVYVSHLAGRYMSNWEYNSACLLFDIYLPASTHFINLNFFILLCCFLVDVN